MKVLNVFKTTRVISLFFTCYKSGVEFLYLSFLPMVRTTKVVALAK